jgi:histidinol-phosphate aminotransferase
LWPDSLALAREYPNVVVLRTFSKAYGLAGLRVGYAVGDPEIITALGKVYVPFTSSTIAQAAAIASVQAAGELLARTDAVVAERGRVGDELTRLGYTFPPSQANFVWLPLGPRTADFAARAAEARVLVRPYGDDGARVSIGAREENDAFLAFAAEWYAADRK